MDKLLKASRLRSNVRTSRVGDFRLTDHRGGERIRTEFRTVEEKNRRFIKERR
jgi:hypothetical protein